MSSISNGTSLKFVNISHPDDVRQKQGLRTEIRRHVMRDIGKNRRRPPKAKKSDSSSPGHDSNTSVRSNNSDQTNRLSTSPLDGTLRPLGGFPIPANNRMLDLARFLSETKTIYIPFREIWFEISLSDPGAFHVTLGNAAALQKTLRQEQDPLNSPEVKSHYAQSVAHLRNRLNHDAENTTSGAIANILAHVCLNMRTGNGKNWAVHMDGLALVYKTRGGFRDLPTNMKTMIMWYDLAGAMVADSTPRFPLPSIPGKLQPAESPISFRLQTLLDSWAPESQSPLIFEAKECIRLFTYIANVVNLRSHSPSFWRQDVGGLMIIGPFLHRLLSMERYGTSQCDEEFVISHSDLALIELLRLTFLVAISRLKELLSMFASERAILQTKLSDFLIYNATHIDNSQTEIKLAVLTIAYLMDSGNSGNDDIYLPSIAEAMLVAGMRTASEVLDITRQLLWINILHSPLEEEFITKLDSYVSLFENI